MLIQQNTIPDGQTASPLCLFLSNLIDVCRPGKPFIKGHSKIRDVIDPLDWLSEEVICSGFRVVLTSFGEEHRGALRDIDSDHPFTQSPL